MDRVMEWQPIDTAPKDGSVFLSATFWKYTFPETNTIRWSGSYWEFLSDANCGWEQWENPTHWMHLPPQPKDTQ